MEVTRFDEVEAERLAGPIFETQAHRKPGASPEFGEGAESAERRGDGDPVEASGASVSEILFAPGERTATHEHTVCQVLYVTEGEGVVATDGEEHEVAEGDLISVPAGEPHWHGAKPTGTFAHVSFLILDGDGEGTVPVEETESPE